MVLHSIYIPIYLAFSLPILLMIKPFNKMMPGARFKLVSMLILLSWFCISCLMLNKVNGFSLWEASAGILFLIGIILFSFMLWSVFCWGYTLSMLLCLPEEGCFNDISTWQNLYTQGNGIQRLTVDRSQVLVWLRCADIKGNTIVLTRFGDLLASFLAKLSDYMGIKQ